MTNFITYFTTNISYIMSLLLNHIQYTFIAILIAICIGVPTALIIYNYKKLAKPILSFTNLVQAIPSLAILGICLPYLGIGAKTGIFVVVLYSLLPIVKNTYTGLSNINPETLEAAKGIGMTPMQVLFKVQIPLASPVIMAGIRISSVTAVGLMTIAAYIGADVLGTLVISGLNTYNTAMILSGAIPACLLALFMDVVMGKIEKAVTPVSLQLEASDLTPEKIRHMKRSSRATLVSFFACFAVIIGAFAVSSMNEPADIVVGSKDAVEGRIVGYIIAEVIEENTDYSVETRMALGGTSIAYDAILTGEIDIYPDYTGTLLTAILGDTYESGTTNIEVYYDVRQNLIDESNLYLLDYYPANNTYVMAITEELAEMYNLKTISDLASIASRLRVGGSVEFVAREDGLLGLQEAMGSSFAEIYSFSGTLMYTAVVNGEVDVISAFSTDALIELNNLVTLEDDINFFPPYNLVPVSNSYFYNSYPDVVELLNEFAPLLTDEVMRELNGYVVLDGLDPEQVAHDFLVSVGWSS